LPLQVSFFLPRLHPFPTRRSSDLGCAGTTGGAIQGGFTTSFPFTGCTRCCTDPTFARTHTPRPELMSADLSSAVSYYFTSSMDYGSELEQLVVAVNRLGESGNSEATETLRWARDSWYEVMLEALGDPTLAKLALLAGDGISYHLDITVDKDDGFVTEETLTAMVKAIQQAG